MINPETIREPSLVELARAGSVRNLRAVESADGSWALVADIGMIQRTLRSKREDVRTWKNLQAVYRYARRSLGINQLQIQGQ